MICKVDGVIFQIQIWGEISNYPAHQNIRYKDTHDRGYSNNCTAPDVEPDTRVFPLFDKQIEERTKLWRSISCTTRELEMCLTVLSEPTEYIFCASGD